MKTILILILLSISICTFGQKKHQNNEVNISLKVENWEFKPQTVEFLEYKSRPAMKLLNSSDPVILKDLNFTNGTIDMTWNLGSPFYITLLQMERFKRNECFYFRTGRAGNPQAIDAVQYAPRLDGVNLWNILFICRPMLISKIRNGTM